LQLDHAPIEERRSLGSFSQKIRIMYAIGGLEGASDQEIEVNVNPALLKLSDEEILFIQLLGVEGARVLGAAIYESARRLKIKKLEAYAVHTESGQCRRQERRILFRWDLPGTLAPICNVDSPKPYALAISGGQVAISDLNESMLARGSIQQERYIYGRVRQERGSMIQNKRHHAIGRLPSGQGTASAEGQHETEESQAMAHGLSFRLAHDKVSEPAASS